MEYKVLRDTGTKLGETNDCTVIAIAAVAGISYETSHRLLAKVGRKPRKGTTIFAVKKALSSAGLSFKEVYNKKNPSLKEYPWMARIKTMKDAGTLIDFFAKDKRFLIFTSSHVAAAKDGKVLDYTKERRHRPLSIYEIEGDTKIPDLNPIEIPAQRINSIFGPPTPRRARNDKYNWVLVNYNTGQPLKKYKRFPRSLNLSREGGEGMLLVNGIKTCCYLEKI